MSDLKEKAKTYSEITTNPDFKQQWVRLEDAQQALDISDDLTARLMKILEHKDKEREEWQQKLQQILPKNLDETLPFHDWDKPQLIDEIVELRAILRSIERKFEELLKEEKKVL